MWMLLLVVMMLLGGGGGGGKKKKEVVWMTTTTTTVMTAAAMPRGFYFFFCCVKSWRSSRVCFFSSLLLLIIAVTVLRSLHLFWQPTTRALAVLKWSKEVEVMARHRHYHHHQEAEAAAAAEDEDDHDHHRDPVQEEKRLRAFASNRSFLAFSAIDPMQEQERDQAKQLLDESFEPGRSSDALWFSKGNRRDHYQDLDERRKLNRWRANPDWRALRASPKYIPFWPKFRLLVNTWMTNKRFEPTVMQRLLATVKDPIDNSSAANSKGRRYGTCAVVGNSGILLNRSYGAVIDDHEMVMRLNNARTMGFEKFVGKKTTVAFINSNILHQCSRRLQCFCHPYGADVPIVMYVCQLIHLMDVAVCSSMQSSPMIVTDPRFDTLTARIVKWYSAKDFVEKTGRPLSEWSDAHEGSTFHYSSGMQAVMLALGICDEVNLFGFGKFNGTKHHYHTSQKKELPLHDYEAEYSFYDDLVNRRLEGAIPFLKDAGIEIPTVHIFQ